MFSIGGIAHHTAIVVKRTVAAGSVALAIAVGAGPATARDFCVGLPGCESASVQQALDAARSNPGRDQVLIGPGDWVGSATVGDDVEIEGSGPATTLTGVPALRVTGGTVGVRRLRLAGSVSAQAGTLSLRDALIDARAPGDGPAVTTAASPGAPVHVVDLQSVTMLGHGQRAIDASAVTPSDHVTVSVRDTVIARFGAAALARTGAGVANLSVDYSDIFPASEVIQQAVGTLTTEAVMNVEPGFGADGMTPAPGSALIDAGTPGAFGPAELDLLGGRRVTPYGCHGARRDIGAVEAVGGCRAVPASRRWWLTASIRRSGLAPASRG